MNALAMKLTLLALAVNRAAQTNSPALATHDFMNIYQLALDEPHDQLFGIYFQAALQQNFDVAFARLK